MRVCVAPDSFKGSLSAPAAAGAMARGVLSAGARACVRVELDEAPVADGGEGTVEAFTAAAGESADRRESVVTGPTGRRVRAGWVVLREAGEHDRRAAGSAVVETASAAGIGLLSEHERDPTRTTTRGLGELIAEAARSGVGRVVVGLGSSGTTDGGIGVGAALGWRFLDAAGAEVEPTGGGLMRIARVVPPTGGLVGERVRVEAMCDVENPLLGERGSAAVFGPQKGASAGQVRELERGLRNLVERCRAAGVRVDPEEAGAGSAGGLGFGLRAFAGAVLRPGFAVVAEAVGLAERVGRADVVLTGEGRVDETTLGGKVVAGVCALIGRGAACGGREGGAGRPGVGPAASLREGLCGAAGGGGRARRGVWVVCGAAWPDEAGAAEMLRGRGWPVVGVRTVRGDQGPGFERAAAALEETVGGWG